jgi:hypothetical protein
MNKNDLKKILEAKEKSELESVILKLYSNNKDNKSFLEIYFSSESDSSLLLDDLKSKVEALFFNLSLNNYYVKKQMLANQKKFNKYLMMVSESNNQFELVYYFLKLSIEHQVDVECYPATETVLMNQIKKVKKLCSKLHEDLQFDYFERVNNLFEDSHLKSKVEEILGV